MANSRGRTASRAHSIISDSSFTPHTTPSVARRSGIATRGVRANTVDSEMQAFEPSVQDTHLPNHYTVPPTVPSPFTGTLDASLDAILHFKTLHSELQGIANTLLRPVHPFTDWPGLLRSIYLHDANGRLMLEEVLCLVTRTLLPEQIAENRDYMARLYDRKKQLAIRLMLRYDMLREWKVNDAGHTMSVASLPPPPVSERLGSDIEDAVKRRPLVPNIIPTLIGAPVGGWTTHAVRERMKHHITDLDTFLLFSDEKISSWTDQALLTMTSQAILQWQWLRQNNETLDEMEINGYEELDGKAEECEWIVDDIKR